MVAAVGRWCKMDGISINILGNFRFTHYKVVHFVQHPNIFYFTATCDQLRVVSVQHHDMYQVYKETNITKRIQFDRLQWAGHVTRMSEERITKTLFSMKLPLIGGFVGGRQS